MLTVMVCAVSGMKVRLAEQQLQWLEPTHLHDSIQSYLDCDESSAQHVLETIGGNLLELGRVHHLLKQQKPIASTETVKGMDSVRRPSETHGSSEWLGATNVIVTARKHQIMELLNRAETTQTKNDLRLLLASKVSHADKADDLDSVRARLRRGWSLRKPSMTAEAFQPLLVTLVKHNIFRVSSDGTFMVHSPSVRAALEQLRREVTIRYRDVRWS